jgi:Methyltransferase domain
MTDQSSADVDQLTANWGDQEAEHLWDRFLSHLPISWSGSTALDFGCGSRYLPKYLVQQQHVAVCHGVDLVAHGDVLSGGSPEQIPGVLLHTGRLEQIAALRNVCLDIVVSTATIPLLRPAELDGALSWIFERLKPGGVCVLDAEPVTSHAAFDVDRRLATPLAHLVFSPREINRYLADRGQEPLRYHNPSCAATYLMQFKRAGFELLRVERHPNPVTDVASAYFDDKLRHFDAQELATARLDVMMRKPLNAPDLTIIDGYVAKT